MAFSFEVKCSGCDYGDNVIWPQWACYQWPLGNTIEIAQQWIWCSTCRSVRIGEALTDIERIERLQAFPIIANAYEDTKKAWATEEIEAALEYARYPRFTNLYSHLVFLKRWGVNQSVVLLQTLKLHREWRLARTSAACCLTCGSSDLVPLAVDQDGEPETFVHPVCGGNVSVRAERKTRAKRLLWTTEGQYKGAG